MGAATAQVVNNRLSDDRLMRAMKGSASQKKMFTLHKSGLFVPANESIARVKDVDDALNTSRIYTAVMGDRWVRCDEYGVFHRDPNAQLGSEIVHVEQGFSYKHLVPNVPVQFDGREISLQRVTGMAIFDSIGLLQIAQTDEKELTISPVDLNALAGRVRAMRFMRNDLAFPDDYGFPNATQPASSGDKAAVYGWVRENFDKEATGYGGSFAGVVDNFGGWLGVCAGADWSGDSGVAFVERVASAPLVAVPEEKLVRVADPNALVQRAEQLETMARDFEKRFSNMLKRFSSMLTAKTHKRFVTELLETATMLRELAGKIEAAKG